MGTVPQEPQGVVSVAECPCLPCGTTVPLPPGNECGTGHLIEAGYPAPNPISEGVSPALTAHSQRCII